MSILSKIFKLIPCRSPRISIAKNIQESRESIQRLEIMAADLQAKEDKTKSHEKLLEIATDDLEEPMWGKDTESCFVFMNPACVNKILRTNMRNALNLTDEDFEHDALAQVCMKSDMIVQNTMRTHRQIEHARYADGTDLWLDTTKSPWIVNGELIGTVGTGRDITNSVPVDIREKYKEPGWIDIPVDLLYSSEDIRKLVGE